MASEHVRILIVEDLAEDAALAKREIRRVVQACDFEQVQTGQDFVKALEEFQPDLVLSDYHLPQFDGMKALSLTLEHAPLTPLIIWTGSLSEDIAVDCMRAGASNYVIKENLKRLGPAVLHALEERRLLMERRLAQEALEKNQRRFQALIENGLDNISLLAIDGTLLWESPAVQRTLGYSPDERQGQNLFDFLHPDDLEPARELFEAVVPAPQDRRSAMFRLRNSQGSWRWVEAIITNMLAEPSVQAVVVNYRDVTERRQAEQALDDSEHRLVLALAGAQMSVWDWNMQTNRIAWSSDLFDFPTESGSSSNGKSATAADVIHPDDVTRVKSSAEKALADGSMFAEEFRIIRPDGEVRWLSNLAHTEYDPTRSNLRLIGTIQDITKRKQAEMERQTLLEIMQGLADSRDLQEFLELIHESIARVIYAQNFFVVIYDKETGLFEEIYSVDQYDPPAPPSKLEKSITSYVFRTGRPLLLTVSRFNELVARGEVELVGTNSESWLGAPLNTPDGTIGVIAVQDYENPSRYSEQDREFLASIAAQVALAIERRRAEEMLQERERRLNAIIENEPECIKVVAPDGSLLQMNPAGLRMIEADDAQMVLGRSVYPLVIEEHRQAFRDLTERVCRGESGKLEFEIIGLKGSRRWLETHAVPMRNEQGEPIGLLGITRDFTERKQTEEDLRAAEGRYRTLVEHIAAITYIAALDEAKSRVYVSPQIETILGYTQAEYVTNANLWRDILHPDDRQRVIADAARFYDTGEPFISEYRSITRDGRVLWFHDEAVIVTEPGSERSFIQGVKIDITERKRSEEETRRHLAELEALYENGLAVGRLLRPREIGDRLIETFAHYLSWHHVAIRLRRADTDELELIAFNQPGLREQERAETERHFNARINTVNQGLSGLVTQTGQPIRTGDVRTHPKYIPTQPGIQSGLYMPLRIGERVIGSISVESELADAFSAQDERLLATLANQAAIAFENARLYQSVQQELAERRRIETALRASETHYRELADSITDVFFELDQDLNYSHWNKASEVLTGVPAAEAIGRSMHEIFGDSDEQKRIEGIYRSVLRDRSPANFETSLELNGEPRAFEINAYPSSRGVAVVAKDVTDRKRSEIVMRKRFELMDYSARHTLEELLQRTIEEVCQLTGSSLGYLHFVSPDETTVSLQTWSPDSARLLQVSSGEATQPSRGQPAVWAEALRERRPIFRNNAGPEPEGHGAIDRQLIIPIIRSEKIVAILGISNKPHDYTQRDLELAERLADHAWDITERKQMELALGEERNQLAQRVEERTADLIHANSNLARALRVKDEFLANMSHELRTPLNAILGLSESLGEQIAGPLNEKQQKYIATISESGHHLLSLINDILDLAKIEAGQITLDINRVDIDSACQSSLRMIRQLAQKKNQDVILEIDPRIGWIWADERRLKQMMVNLLSNAVKFTPDGGRLGLEVSASRDDNEVMLTVWDNGIGMQESDLSRLFQPFVQLDSGLARETTGTGLGLALVAQMVRLHGGSVRVSSGPEQGSRFTIVLPWEPALASDTGSRMKITGKFRAISPDATHRPTVLLIEDTHEVIMMIKDYLELAGYQVVVARDGVEGITQAKLIHPDLILMDVMMPRMDGLEASRRLRKDPDFDQVPIIALTALAMPSDRERCLEAGMNDYMSKPVNLKELAKTIHRFLVGEEKASP